MKRFALGVVLGFALGLHSYAASHQDALSKHLDELVNENRALRGALAYYEDPLRGTIVHREPTYDR